MPDWIANNLRVKKGDAMEIFNFVRNEQSAMDFNKVVPMPENFEANCCSLEKATEFTFRDGQKALPLYAAEPRRTWNLIYWGTNRNACFAEYSLTGANPVLGFDTAGSAPVPVFRALAKLFPSHEIVIHSRDASGAFNAVFTLKNGEVKERSASRRNRKAQEVAAA